MSFTIESGKELAGGIIPRPLILCKIACTDGDTLYLSTAAELTHDYLAYGGNNYLCRIAGQTIDAIQAMSAQGYDIPGSVTLTINDGDLSIWTNHIAAHAWRGATLTLTMLLWDAVAAAFSTNSYLWTFVLGKPKFDAGKGVVTVEAQALTSMTRIKVPTAARTVRCIHAFPATPAQQLAALTDPTSAYSGCGYSKGQSGTGWDGTVPVGNLNSGVPFTTCDYTRQNCEARGMFSTDSSANITSRFSGDTWSAPTEYKGRNYVSSQRQTGFNTPNPATGNEYYPVVYGTQWVNAVVLEPALDPNSLRFEAVVCMAYFGAVTIRTVVVNGIEIPYEYSDKLFTWRFAGGTHGGTSSRGSGGRNGWVNQDATFNLAPGGDPHGSMAVIEIVIPMQLASTKPTVQVLVSGPPTLQVYPISSATAAGGGIVITFPGTNRSCAGNPPFRVGVAGNSFVPDGFSTLTNWTSTTITLTTTGTGTGTGGYVYFWVYNTNPVWHLLDLMTSVGPFSLSDFEYTTWYAAAAWCDVSINYTDSAGNTQSHERFRSSFVMDGSNRSTLAQAVTELRNCAGIILSKNSATGKIQCSIKRGLADQQPAAITGSNYNTAVASVLADGSASTGYLAYLFDGAGSITRNTLKIDGRSINDTPNRIAARFQNEDNAWSDDSLSQIDPNAYISSGSQVIDAPFAVRGVPNFDQMSRRANVELAEALYGNLRNDAGGTDIMEFETTVKAAHLASMVGAICGLTYEQLGF